MLYVAELSGEFAAERSVGWLEAEQVRPDGAIVEAAQIDVLELKKRVASLGNRSIEEWEERWCLKWDLAKVRVKYRQVAEWEISISVEIERQPGKPCTADSKGLPGPTLGFPTIGLDHSMTRTSGVCLFGEAVSGEHPPAVASDGLEVEVVGRDGRYRWSRQLE